MAPLQQGCRRRRAPAASLVLASLLLIAAAARLPTAAAQRASPSPSPEESPSPSPEESPSPSPEESPSPSPDESPSPSPDASPSPSPDVGPAPSPISLDYPANRNANNQPVLTVTKANIDGRDVYYEVRPPASLAASRTLACAAQGAQPLGLAACRRTPCRSAGCMSSWGLPGAALQPSGPQRLTELPASFNSSRCGMSARACQA